MKVLLGKNEYDEIVEAELKEDRTIRGFNCYTLIEINNDTYREFTAWTHKSMGRESGEKLPENVEVVNMTDDDITEFNDAYEGSIAYCDDCCKAHDMDDYYNPDFKVLDCFIKCNECCNAEDLLVEVNDAEDLFNSKDIREVDFDGEDFQEVETLFCDSSGFGGPNEPALTKAQVEVKVSELLKEHGQLYGGLTGIGQFQVYVTLYKKTA